MLHGLPSPNIAFRGARLAGPVLPGDPVIEECIQSLRALHATMLAYAADRRRAAAEPADSDYWKAGEAHAVSRAQSLRARPGFARLP